MKIEQRKWTESTGWEPKLENGFEDDADLIFVFGGTNIIKSEEQFLKIKQAFPRAQWVGCSTAGEICDTEVSDDSLVVTIVKFENTEIHSVFEQVSDVGQSFSVGKNLAKQLIREDLKHIFVLSEGINVNGSELVKGFNDELPKHITVTGGLSGDGSRFSETFIVHNGRSHRAGVVAVGFYGDSIEIGCGSLGGWDSFGPERVVTKSENNVLFELDGKSALLLYKEYLGEYAKDLPSSGLLFPLCLHNENQQQVIIRTILSIDEKQNSLIFAGDIPQGSVVRLMKANFNRLVDGAVGAAGNCLNKNKPEVDLSILISCVGRKLILKQRTEEEVEGVREVVGEKCILTGFYSYGEIGPFSSGIKKCELHNQTMTVTTFSESKSG